jgi:hypothetical protein
MTTDSAIVEGEALSSDELDRVAGGNYSIIAGYYGYERPYSSALDRVALNPQPLPPGPDPYVLVL